MRSNPRSTFAIAGHPLHPLLVILPIGCWIAAFVTDFLYWRGGGPAHLAYVSTWLILAGIVTAVIAAIAGFTDFLLEPRIRDIGKAWWHMWGNLLAVVIAIIDFMFHFRDGAAAVLPTGIVLSGIVVLLLLFNGWMGGELVFRHRVAVIAPDERED